MKRASTVFRHTRSKRPRLVEALPRRHIQQHVVSATHIHNYMINDTLVDWLKLRSRRGGRNVPSSFDRGFTDYIMQRGVDFEKQMVKYIHENRVPVVYVSDYINGESCRKAISLMKEGVPVLHSVPVRNNYAGTQGVIDLLVRSDYLSKIVDLNPLEPAEETKRAGRLAGDYHYVVVDIKFSTLPLRSDGIHLLNSGHYPAYKAQTLVYTQAIGRIQGYTPPYAFLLGRRWRYTSQGITHRHYTCLNRLGKIDYNNVDAVYKDRTNRAIKWVRDVAVNGSSWSVNPPSRPELYPNMCVDSGLWNLEKEQIAKDIGEITSVWYVGAKHRNYALLEDIKSWKDSRCTTLALNLKGKRAEVIDKILDVNRQTTDLIRPAHISNNHHGWKNKCNEVYVDFETLSDIFSDFEQLPSQAPMDIIFMIGVGWEENGQWMYKSFICNGPTREDEYRIMDEFVQFLRTRGSPKIHYWSAEKRFWTTAECRQFDRASTDSTVSDHISDDWKLNDWCDLCDVFQKEPIVIKGCFKFGLKPIAKAMLNHGMISTKIESKCDSGMIAMVKAWECYKKSGNPAEADTMKDIAMYNEFDCKVLWDIVRYLRANHV